MGNAPFSFQLPPILCAGEPPEQRGVARDQIRMLVAHRDSDQVEHSRLTQLHHFLNPGDLLVFNNSRTLPASLQGCAAPAGPCLEARLAEHLPDDAWLALLLCQNGDPAACGLRAGMKIGFGMGLEAVVEGRDSFIPRLWKLRFSKSGPQLIDLLYRIGCPIRYEHVSAPWNLDAYQTVFAREPGSAEMPSAGRGFTWRLLFDLKRRGIEQTCITLHAGLSFYADDPIDRTGPSSEEELFISDPAAQKIERTRSAGGKIVAVGTTVVRALESAVDSAGYLRPGHRYTRLRIDSSHALRVADGLITGFHEPEASHLDLLAAFLPAARIQRVYQEAVQAQYLWHEFGDLNLIL
jgi:S-adenosylmethionine:tRNA ribosyltransferase-isomerase